MNHYFSARRIGKRIIMSSLNTFGAVVNSVVAHRGKEKDKDRGVANG